MDSEATSSRPPDSQTRRQPETMHAEDREALPRNKTVDACAEDMVLYDLELEHILRKDTVLIDDDMKLVEQKANTQFDLHEHSDVQLQLNFSGDEKHMLLSEACCKDVMTRDSVADALDSSNGPDGSSDEAKVARISDETVSDNKTDTLSNNILIVDTSPKVCSITDDQANCETMQSLHDHLDTASPLFVKGGMNQTFQVEDSNSSARLGNDEKEFGQSSAQHRADVGKASNLSSRPCEFLLAEEEGPGELNEKQKGSAVLNGDLANNEVIVIDTQKHMTLTALEDSTKEKDHIGFLPIDPAMVSAMAVLEENDSSGYINKDNADKRENLDTAMNKTEFNMSTVIDDEICPHTDAVEAARLNGQNEIIIQGNNHFDNIANVPHMPKDDVNILLDCEENKERFNKVGSAFEQDTNALLDTSKVALTDANMRETNDKYNRDVSAQERGGFVKLITSNTTALDFQDYKITEVVAEPVVLAVDSENQRPCKVNQAIDLCLLQEENNLTNAELVDRNCKEERGEIALELKSPRLAISMDADGQEIVFSQVTDSGSQSMLGMDYKPMMIKNTRGEENRSSEAASKNGALTEAFNPHPDDTISLHGNKEGIITQVHRNLLDPILMKSIVDAVDSCPTNLNSLVETEDFRKEAFPVSRSYDLQSTQNRLNGGSERASGSSPNLGSKGTCLGANVYNSLLKGANNFIQCLPQAGISPSEYFDATTKQFNALKNIRNAASPALDVKSSLASNVQGFSSCLLEQTICPTVDSSRVVGVSSRSQLAHPFEQATVPDLNTTEAASAARATQPFTDVQQVQLRAQILVYGSLIQGALPDEALMAPAFKDINGAGRQDIRWEAVATGAQFWESAWRAAVDRIKSRTMLNAPKEAAQSATAGVLPGRMPEEGQWRFSLNPSAASITCNVDARSHPVSTARFSEVSVPRSHVSRTRQNSSATITARISAGTPPVPLQNHSYHQIKFPSIQVFPSPFVDAIQNPSGSRLAQLDSVRLPFRSVLPSPQITPFIPGTSHWVSSASVVRTEWLSHGQAAGLDANTSFACVQSFTGRDGSQDLLNNQRNKSTSWLPFVPVSATIPATGEIDNISSVLKGNIGASGLISPNYRPRKRKKIQLDSNVQHDMDTSATPNISMWCSTSSQAVACSLSLPNVASTALTEPRFTGLASSHIPVPVVQVPFTSIGCCSMMPGGPNTLNSLASQYLLASGRANERLVTHEISAEDLEQAKLMSEEATSFADAAVKHCESLWNQLQSQKNSSIVSGKKINLVSSAVAMSAAASVAKAAAAAGRVAYEAALQAKLMGEALGSSDSTNYGLSGSRRSGNELMLIQGSSETDQSGNKTEGATFGTQTRPNNFTSVISNAKDAAKKRLEDMSAAEIRQHNTESIIKAAELATKAVLHVGDVVAIGEHIPFTLDMLLDAGPHDLHLLVNAEISDHTLRKEKVDAEKMFHRSSVRRGKQSKGKGIKEANDSLEDRKLKKSSEQPCQLSVGRSVCESKTLGNDKESQMTTRCTDIVAIATTQASEKIVYPNEGTLPGRTHVSCVSSASYLESCQIGEGSIVEVLSDEEGLRGVWFSARVKSIENGKALVIYDELLSDDNSLLEERIDLGTLGEAPKIRLAHPIIKINYDGARKRRRTTMGNYNWSAGDRVDAWIKDGWWEGEVLDKSEDDETKIKVHFSGEGDTAFIKPWNLRPSLLWKDDHWLLWTDIKHENQNNHVEYSGLKDGLPAAKRRKVDSGASGESHLGKQQVAGEGLENTAKGVTENVSDVRSDEIQVPQKSNLTLSASAGEAETSKNVVRENMIVKDLRMDQAIEGHKIVLEDSKPSKNRKLIEVSRMTDSSLKDKMSAKYDKIGRHEVTASRNNIDSNCGRKDPIERIKKQSQGVLDKAKESKQRKRVFSTHRKKPSGVDASSRKPVSIHGPKVGKMSMLPVTQDMDVQKSNILFVAMPKQPGMQKHSLPSRIIQLSKDADEHPVLSKNKVGKERTAQKLSTEVLEPRRSSRRIQPTSKLLEGLQSAAKFG